MIAPAKPVPLRRDVIERIADVWIDDQLLAQAIANGDSLLDSATVDAANWPIIVQTIVNNYHDSAMAPTADAQQLDSAVQRHRLPHTSRTSWWREADTHDAVKAAKGGSPRATRAAQARREFRALASRVWTIPAPNLGRQLG